MTPEDILGEENQSQMSKTSPSHSESPSRQNLASRGLEDKERFEKNRVMSAFSPKLVAKNAIRGQRTFLLAANSD